MAESQIAAPLDGIKEEQQHLSNGVDGVEQGEAGPSRPRRYRFRPTRHLHEPPQAPPTDHKIEEEAAAQAAAQAAGYEGRRMRRFMQRRTVDYMGTWLRYRDKRVLDRSTARGDYSLKPSPHFVIDLLPSAAAQSTVSCVAPHLVHTSTNKIRTPVNVVKWMPSTRRLLTGSSSGEFTLWNGLTFNFETILQACDNGVRDLEWSASGNLLISGDAGGTVKYFLPNMNNVLAIDAHRESIRGLSFSPDDARWISGSDDSTIKIWNTERGAEETVLKGHGWDVKCVQWHPFKGLIASGGKDNLVKFWDPRKGGREIGTFHGHKNTVQALRFSPSHVSSSEILATASRDQTIKLYDIRMIKEFETLRAAPAEPGASTTAGGGGGAAAEAGGVCSLAWHPHAPLLSSGLSTGVLQHHSLSPSATPDLPISTVPQAHDQSIWAMSWHPLGQILVTGGNDCLTRWWERERLEMGDLKHQSSTMPGAEDGGGATAVDGGRRNGGAYDDDDDQDQANTSMGGFIPGFNRGGAGGGAGGAAGGGRPPQAGAMHPSRAASGRAPPPPGFDARGGWSGARDSPSMGGVGGGGSQPPSAPPHATGANMQDGVRDTGWGNRGPGVGGMDPYAQQQQAPYGGSAAPGGNGFALPGMGGGGMAAPQTMPGFGNAQSLRQQPPGQPPQPPPGGFGYGYGGGGQQQQQGGYGAYGAGR